jgi:hypothetical protein
MSVKEEASEVGKVVIWGLIIVAIISVLGFAANSAGYLQFKFFAPKIEAVRHNTYECGQSHVDGLARELHQYMDQYRSASDDSSRAILVERIKHEVESYTCNDVALPDDIVAFSQSH